MSWFTGLAGKVEAFFTSGAAQKKLELALKLAPKAVPIINILVKLTPTTADDTMWDAAKKKFPHFFDGSFVPTPDEKKLFLSGIAADTLKQTAPEADTNTVRAAVELAYMQKPPTAATV